MASVIENIISKLRESVSDNTRKIFSFREESNKNDGSLKNIIGDAYKAIRQNSRNLSDLTGDISELRTNDQITNNKIDSTNRKIKDLDKNNKSLSNNFEKLSRSFSSLTTSINKRLAIMDSNLRDIISSQKRLNYITQTQPQTFKIPGIIGRQEDRDRGRYRSPSLIQQIGGTILGGSILGGTAFLGGGATASPSKDVGVTPSGTPEPTTGGGGSGVSPPPSDVSAPSPQPEQPPRGGSGGGSGQGKAGGGSGPPKQSNAGGKLGPFDASKFYKEVQNTPGLYEHMLRLAAKEQGSGNVKDITRQLETWRNRAILYGKTIADITDFNKKHLWGSGSRKIYWADLRRMSPQTWQNERVSKSVRAKIDKAFHNAFVVGSNESKGATHAEWTPTFYRGGNSYHKFGIDRRGGRFIETKEETYYIKSWERVNDKLKKYLRPGSSADLLGGKTIKSDQAAPQTRGTGQQPQGTETAPQPQGTGQPQTGQRPLPGIPQPQMKGGSKISEGGLHFPLGPHGMQHGGHGRTANFGYERNRLHAGVDLYPMDPKNKKLLIGKQAPVMAVEDGTIVRTLMTQSGAGSGSGNMVVIRGKSGRYYRYLHLTPNMGINPETGKPFRVGDKINAGQVFQYIGGTGTSFGKAVYQRMLRAQRNGRSITYQQALQEQINYYNKHGWGRVAKPHLHFETRRNAYGRGVGAINPAKFFPEYSRARGVIEKELFGLPEQQGETPSVTQRNAPERPRGIEISPPTGELEKKVETKASEISAKPRPTVSTTDILSVMPPEPPKTETSERKIPGQREKFSTADILSAMPQEPPKTETSERKIPGQRETSEQTPVPPPKTPETLSKQFYGVPSYTEPTKTDTRIPEDKTSYPANNSKKQTEVRK